MGQYGASFALLHTNVSVFQGFYCETEEGSDR